MTKLTSILAFISVLMCSEATGSDRIQNIRVVSEEWQGYTNSDGTGLYWEIVTTVFSSAGIQVELSTTPWKRAKQQVKRQVADAYVGDYYYPKGHTGFLYPSWHISIEEDVVVRFRKGTLDWENRRYGSLHEKKVAWVRGYDFDQGFLEGVRLIKVEVDSVEQGVTLLEKGRVDALVDYGSALSMHAPSTSTSQFVTVVTKKGEKLFLVFSDSENSNSLAAIFDIEMEKLVKNGTIAELYEKYGISFELYQSSIQKR
ncbi:substrate-binding periplasmic protein [Vibrio bivalvicida]|uniref:Substrate-binding periplasmic protein n=1 Tax=Vibrio bivalvicida TaxID=1276888 RepID=A0ABV4MQB9_9VIBR